MQYLFACVIYVCVFAHFSNIQYQDIRDKIVCYKPLKTKPVLRCYRCVSIINKSSVIGVRKTCQEKVGQAGLQRMLNVFILKWKSEVKRHPC